ncbi:protein kinase [Arthrobacter sp. ERGS1:01]|uniref:Stk1 family PASTA domain-containing Ser/Thr kinase n=1 Tax=Arthrobacter sp. ERGS1:01 TaxID=1704044 RepID=UPI0006B4C90D|nr:Stk1 family PASTA domain-containing Ser/Thr kinase [Arthrobacter sp. ERGS1:01]ALE05459.1 protein kinase [Arthrobacter sp. ERGS1:01]
MQDLPHDPLIGSTIDDRYLVLSKVARGGMSTVYLAKDIRLNRNIALKILHPHLATDNAFIERLQREAWSAASLSHPHVVQIHDHGVGAAHAYLVLEYIDGHTLRDVINQGRPLTPRQALDMLDPIVEGLAAAHAAGLVHRDVKPENVLISRSGWVKIGDFGLSRAVTTTTNTATLLGTVGYIAPELVNGEGGDARSDIYSAGIMLYELLTGAQPFQGKVPIAVAMAHVRDAVPTPSAAVPGLPSEMDELVRYMTEKDPDNRPANGASLLEDLRHIRRTLTPEELDFAAPGADSIGRPGAGATEVIGAQPALDTGALTAAIGQPPAAPAGGWPGATTVIAGPSYPTSVLPSGSGLYVNDADRDVSAYSPDYSGGDDETDDDGVALSKREARAEARARAKAAAQPTTTLGHGHPRRRALVWVLVVLVLGFLVAMAGWFLALGPGALATVPDVHNKTVAQAQALLHAQGFDKSASRDVFDEKVAAGLVVDTDPAAGSSLRRFLGVTILVSKGPVLYPVPELTGKDLANAKSALSDGSLALGTVTEAFNEKIPAGTVISQNPKAGAEFRGNTKVDVVVSKGPKPIPVPSVVGKTGADAQASLKAAGLTPAIAPEQLNSATVPAGSVLSQAPDSGTLTAGGTVTITLSKGPRMIAVPDMIGKQVGVATAELKALGFKVEVENLLGGFFGTVRFQSPQGVDAPEGSTIILKVI